MIGSNCGAVKTPGNETEVTFPLFQDVPPAESDRTRSTVFPRFFW